MPFFWRERPWFAPSLHSCFFFFFFFFFFLKILNATVVAVGPGFRTSVGNLIPCSCAPGDVVLLPEFGGTKVQTEDENVEMMLFRDSDILAKWQES